MEAENHLIQERIRKLKALREKGINPYPYKYDVKNHAFQLHQKYDDKLKAEEKTQDYAKVAGRIVALRRMGKASFVSLLDETGKIQLYLNQDNVGKPTYKLLKKLDIGDWIGAEGIIFKTRTNETTIEVKDYSVLSKSLRPLPEKFHGLKDTELRYRMRYLDLISNPETRMNFTIRSCVIAEIRKYLNENLFLEVETPALQTIYGGANARPFKTHHHELEMDMYLRISPELYLKRLLVGGFERVYTICKNFRNEGIDTNHNPEFTMVEFYRAFADYNDMMEMTEQLIERLAKKATGKTKIKYLDKEIEFKAPFKRLTMVDSLKEYGGIDINSLNFEEIKLLIQKHNIDFEGKLTKGLAIQLLFEELVEEKLIQPTFIIDHPIESTPLCKTLRDGDQDFIERFELFINGMEIANAYSELNDAIKQKELLLEQVERGRAGEDETHPMDDDFVKAIEYGMPPAGGVGIGVDRVVMLLTNSDSIRDVILFPTMKPRVEDEK